MSKSPEKSDAAKFEYSFENENYITESTGAVSKKELDEMIAMLDN